MNVETAGEANPEGGGAIPEGGGAIMLGGGAPLAGRGTVLGGAKYWGEFANMEEAVGGIGAVWIVGVAPICRGFGGGRGDVCRWEGMEVGGGRVLMAAVEGRRGSVGGGADVCCGGSSDVACKNYFIYVLRKMTDIPSP